MLTFTTDQWVILGLVFVLGTLIGMWLTAGGRRKWKSRYTDEVEKRRTIERDLKDREGHWETREKEWRERETLAAAGRRDRDGDGYVDRRPDDRPVVVERHTATDRPVIERHLPDDRPAAGRHSSDDRRY